MKLEFKTLFRAWIIVMVCLFGWALWASAQSTNTNIATTTTVMTGGQTNAVVESRYFSPEQESLLTFGLNRVETLQYKILSIPLWQYIASFIYVFLAFYLSKLVDYVTRNQLRRLTRKTKTDVDEMVLELIDGPIVIITFVIFLHMGLHVFQWPEWMEQFLKKGLYVVVACSITYMLVKLIDLFVDVWKRRVTAKSDAVDKTYNDQLFPIVGKSIKAFVVIVAGLVTMQNLGINITGLIASLSITGLALGLAAQDTVANLFGAVSVFVDKPFQIGDLIRAGDVYGTVETIGLRSTRVRSLDGHLITVPNKTMGNATITNVTKRPTLKSEINIGIAYETSVEKTREAINILREVYSSHPKTHDVIVTFNQFKDSALNLMVIHWWKAPIDGKEYNAGIQELNLTVKDRFEKAGIEFAYPTQTLLVKRLDEGNALLPSAPAKV